eukprot:1157159-Pelagomonas_calceolata.AAC.2
MVHNGHEPPGHEGASPGGEPRVEQHHEAKIHNSLHSSGVDQTGSLMKTSYSVQAQVVSPESSSTTRPKYTTACTAVGWIRKGALRRLVTVCKPR